ncbi:hypothetical protein FACS1894158_02660 [Betaproteobacteria bacterium]|nr:hypothetical protein FACS1894158_02660 [Betaproteobacteria bacterium]
MERHVKPGAYPLAHSLMVMAVLLFTTPAQAQDSEFSAPLWTALQKTEIAGSVMYFQRNRERYRVDEDRFGSNLHHSTLQSEIHISTPYVLNNTLGLEVGFFGTTDLGNGAGAPDHEISFFPWQNPWSADWSKRDASSGVSLYRAHLKAQNITEQGRWWGKLGYFQPEGPGVLGVNWSLMPGTFSGAEGGFEHGPLSVAGAYVTRYKAPWYRHTYRFLDSEQRDTSNLWSLGARYTLATGLTAEAAYGEAPGYLRSAHLKFKYDRDGRYASYQLYVMGDRASSGANDLYAGGGKAWQHYLAFSQAFAPYTFKAEFTHTRAPTSSTGHVGYFAYRLSGWYGGVKGAYEPWWDNRSDWNHNRESAAFLSLSRTLGDWGLPGARIGASAARGWSGRVYGVSETLKERAWSIDLGYRLSSGVLKDASFSLHYTRYDNGTHLPSWTGYKNLFQDERDVKVLVVIPWQG